MNHYTIHPVHIDGSTEVTRCEDPRCERMPHGWSLYKVITHDTLLVEKWVEDFGSQTDAERALVGYNQAVADLTQQLAAAIMDCIAVREQHLPAAQHNGDVTYYAWGNDRSQIYVDVALMARSATEWWMLADIAGIIYEVSEAIANACIEERSLLGHNQIRDIIFGLQEVGQCQ